MSDLKQLPVPGDAVRDALRNLINDDWERELDDYGQRSQDPGSGGPEGHPFVELVTLDNWLTGKSAQPRDYLTEGDGTAPRPLAGRTTRIADALCALREWEEAKLRESSDAEYDAGLALAEALRNLLGEAEPGGVDFPEPTDDHIAAIVKVLECDGDRDEPWSLTSLQDVQRVVAKAADAGVAWAGRVKVWDISDEGAEAGLITLDLDPWAGQRLASLAVEVKYLVPPEGTPTADAVRFALKEIATQTGRMLAARSVPSA